MMDFGRRLLCAEILVNSDIRPQGDGDITTIGEFAIKRQKHASSRCAPDSVLR